jgi:hypothetical protein
MRESLWRINKCKSVILLGFAVSCFFASVARADVCVQGSHKLSYQDNTADVQDYRCALGADKNSPALRVTFYRLDEALAGSLVKTAIPEIEEIMGRLTIIDNDVSKIAHTLFDSYGSHNTYDFTAANFTWTLRISDDGNLGAANAEDDDAGPSPRSRKKPPRPTKVRDVWYLLRGDHSLTSKQIVMSAPTVTILNTDHWPDKPYKLFYDAGCPAPYIACTTVWRYIAPPDFDLILNDIREYVRRADQKLKRTASFDKIIPDYQKSLDLYRYLAQQGWPEDFLAVYTKIGLEECTGDVWSFTYGGRPLTLDVAILENISDQPIRIEDFIGSRNTSQNIRPVSAAGAGENAGSIGLAAANLDAGAKLALPLRITFAHTGDEWTLDSAEEMYNTIRSSKQQVFDLGIGKTNPRNIRKTRDSFKEPEVPTASDYLYGPAMSLSGLVIDGKTYSIPNSANPASPNDAPTSNNLSFFVEVGPADGSCPVLFSWNEDAKSWISLGKILHRARGSENEMAETIKLPAFQSHFRLAETELEASFIKSITMKLTLDDDRVIELSPRQFSKGTIPAYSSIDFDFDLPSDISVNEIAQTAISINGYYERYSSIVAAEPLLEKTH